jgi:hypothetical protein
LDGREKREPITLTGTRNLIVNFKPRWIKPEEEPIPDVDLSFSFLLAWEAQLGFEKPMVRN